MISKVCSTLPWKRGWHFQKLTFCWPDHKTQPSEGDIAGLQAAGIPALYVPKEAQILESQCPSICTIYVRSLSMGLSRTFQTLYVPKEAQILESPIDSDLTYIVHILGH